MAHPEGSHIYEVGMPHASREQQLALQGLAGAFGWTLEKTNEQPNHAITEETFQETSAHIWGDPVYGTIANSLITEDVWQDYPLKITRESRHFQLTSPYTIQTNDGYIGRTTDSPAVVENNLRRLWDVRAAPFELLIEKPVNSNPADWTLLQGDMTQPRLANFVVGHGWNAHGLHGSLGKAMEVMSVTAGLLQPDEVNTEIDAENQGPFIEMKDFEARLRAAPMPSHRRKVIREHISDTLATQVKEARSSYYGELIAEGLVTRNGFSYRAEKLAVYSLLTIRRLVRFEDQRDFLDSIVETR